MLCYVMLWSPALPNHRKGRKWSSPGAYRFAAIGSILLVSDWRELYVTKATLHYILPACNAQRSATHTCTSPEARSLRNNDIARNRASIAHSLPA